jgi:hypothetical protein
MTTNQIKELIRSRPYVLFNGLASALTAYAAFDVLNQRSADLTQSNLEDVMVFATISALNLGGAVYAYYRDNGKKGSG